MADTQNFYWSPFKKLHEILIKPSHNLGGCNILKHWTWSRNWTEAVKGETANKFGNLFWTTWHWDPSAAASPKFLDLSLHTNWFAVLPPLGKTLISVQHNFCQTTGGVDFKHRLVLMTMWILMTMSTISMLLLTFGTWRWRWPSSQPTPGQLASGQSGSRGQQWQSNWHSWGWFIDNHNHNMVTRFPWVLALTTRTIQTT